MARLFILGAGFSRPAGLPLTTQLLGQVLEELRSIHGGATHLHRALDTYRSFLDDTLGKVPATIDAEQFAEFLDYRHFLGLLGSDTWAEEGNRDQFLLRWGIGRLIHRLTPRVLPSLYLGFAERLEPDDVVVTFNYDLLIESSLEALGKRFRRFPSRYSEIHMHHAIVDSEAERGEILISKLHGSIDWVSRAGFDRVQREYLDWGDRATADFSRKRDLLFGPNAVAPTKPLVEGPRPLEDPLTPIQQITDLEGYYANHRVAYSHPPLLLAPSRAKQLYGNPLRPFWEGMGRFGWAWGGLAVIGYSLPEDDLYTRQVLWELASGYRTALEDPEWRIQDVHRIVVVDYRNTNQTRDLLERAYRFFPPEYTDFVLTGFDERALELLFHSEPFGRLSKSDAPETAD